MQELIKSALAAREQAYAPYSQFAVGAALMSVDGQIFQGCNMENASYGLSICAERAALCAAIAAGKREFSAIAIVLDGPHKSPCGACRQCLAEFGLELEVIALGTDGVVDFHGPLSQLLPHAFQMQSQ